MDLTHINEVCTLLLNALQLRSRFCISAYLTQYDFVNVSWNITFRRPRANDRYTMPLNMQHHFLSSSCLQHSVKLLETRS
jgi:hypothetical protein